MARVRPSCGRRACRVEGTGNAVALLAEVAFPSAPARFTATFGGTRGVPVVRRRCGIGRRCGCGIHRDNLVARRLMHRRVGVSVRIVLRGRIVARRILDVEHQDVVRYCVAVKRLPASCGGGLHRDCRGGQAAVCGKVPEGAHVDRGSSSASSCSFTAPQKLYYAGECLSWEVCSGCGGPGWSGCVCGGEDGGEHGGRADRGECERGRGVRQHGQVSPTRSRPRPPALHTTSAAPPDQDGNVR